VRLGVTALHDPLRRCSTANNAEQSRHRVSCRITRARQVHAPCAARARAHIAKLHTKWCIVEGGHREHKMWGVHFQNALSPIPLLV